MVPWAYLKAQMAAGQWLHTTHEPFKNLIRKNEKKEKKKKHSTGHLDYSGILILKQLYII